MSTAGIAVPVLRERRIMLGVTGSIAAYKAVDLASRLVAAGAAVDVGMTPSAQHFVTPLTFQGIVHQPVVSDPFSLRSEMSMEHIALAARADALLIAPATANILAHLAAGMAGDIVTSTALATRAPVLIAPAMEGNMWRHPATQANVATLKERGVIVVGPERGRLASGEIDDGRLASLDVILGALRWALGRTGDLAGRRVVVTAGGTREPLDPVRHLGNRSSGKMGHALAAAARDRGAQVTLVTAAQSGPVESWGMTLQHVNTALEMRDAVLAAVRQADVLIMAAAVADYRPTAPAAGKVKKERDLWSVELVRNPDILSEVPAGVLKVGFAAETEDVVANARLKLSAKGLSLVVANDVSAPDSGFEVDTNRVTLISAAGEITELPLLPKLHVADRVLDRVRDLLARTRLQDAPREEVV